MAILLPYIYDVAEVEAETQYGFPTDMVEDCEEYPDHFFYFVVEPESRFGRPAFVRTDEEFEEDLAQGQFLTQGETTPSTELVVTEEVPRPLLLHKKEAFHVSTVQCSILICSCIFLQYDCQWMMGTILWFKVLHYMMYVYCAITMITTVITILGIVALLYIQARGVRYSILPPAVVEPYELYDEIMTQPSEVSIPDARDDPTDQEQGIGVTV